MDTHTATQTPTIEATQGHGMTDDIHIRTATIDDAERIASFNVALASESERKELASHVVTSGVRRALEDPTHCKYYVAEVAGNVVGQTMITREWSDWRAGFFWWIQSVYVHPEHRRKGVFRLLHQHIREEAMHEPGVCGLRLYVHHTNDRALKTYEGLNMRVADYHLCEEEFPQRP